MTPRREKPAARERPHRARTGLLLSGALLALLAAAGARWRLAPAPPGSEREFRQLLQAVARRPGDIDARAAFARHLHDRGLTFGVIMELSLMPAEAPRESRRSAAEAYVSLGLADRALPVYRELLAAAAEPGVAGRAAVLFREEGDFRGALRAVETALERAPAHPVLEFDRLRALLDLGDYPSVVRAGTVRLARHPEDDETRILLAWAQLLAGRPAETVALLAGLRAADPPPWADVLRGRALLALGRAADAAAAFQRAAAEEPEQFEAHLGAAGARAALGRWEDAAAAARRAAEIQPLASAPWDLLARAHAAGGRARERDWALGCRALAAEDPDAAVPFLRRAATGGEARHVKDLARALLLQSRRRPALDLLAAECARLGDPVLIRYWYDSAFDLRQFPEALRAARLLAASPDAALAAEGEALAGQVLREQGDWRAAEAAFTAALSRRPGEAVFLAERGRTWMQAGGEQERLARAEADLRRAAEGDPAIPPLHHDLAVAALERDRPESAFLSLCRSLSLLGNRSLDVPLALLSKTASRLGLREEARWCAAWTAELKQAEDRFRVAGARPSSPERERALAAAALELHDDGAARAALIRLCRLEPGTAENWLRLAAVCQRLGLYDERVAAIERWRRLGGAAAPAADGA